jgi:hypothetical protein
MRYVASLIPTTVRGLRDLVVTTLLRAPTRHFPDDCSEDFDGSYHSLERGVENLRKKFGDTKSDQLLDMIRQAKKHHEANDKLGSRLLQDVEMVIANRQPYAYPPELYRWPLDPSLPELSNADLLNPKD